MEFYHTYNRGVEKRKIFLEDSDYFRAVHDLYEFNNIVNVSNLNRNIVRCSTPNNLVDKVESRKKLLDKVLESLGYNEEIN